MPDDDWKSPVPGRGNGLGRHCPMYLLPALLLMPYALIRYAVDRRRDRKAA